jgi:uncharacterized membrane protein
MTQAKVPIKHEYKKSVLCTIIDKAFLWWDEKELNKGIEKLKESGCTDDNNQSAKYFWPSFLCNFGGFVLSLPFLSQGL